MCWFAICISSLVKHLFKSLAHFKTGLFDYLLSSKSLIDRRSGRQILFQMCVSQISSPRLWLGFSPTLQDLFEEKCSKFSYEVHWINYFSCVLCILYSIQEIFAQKTFYSFSSYIYIYDPLQVNFCLWYKVKFNVLFSPLPLDILLFQDHLLKSLSFFYWITLAPLLKINWAYKTGSISKWSILFDWVTCQSLCQQVCWELQLYGKSQNRVVWILCFLPNSIFLIIKIH